MSSILYPPTSRSDNNTLVAGFLTCSRNCAFPSFDSGILQFPFAELTAAGTVQDLHLFPSQDLTIKILHHFADAKIQFFLHAVVVFF